jgi:hypothetical protein
MTCRVRVLESVSLRMESGWKSAMLLCLQGLSPHTATHSSDRQQLCVAEKRETVGTAAAGSRMSSKSRKNTMVGATGGGRRETTAPDSRVRRNHRGGILISPEEIKLAFDFLDCDKSGKVSLANLKKRLAVFFPEMSAKEYRFMMNNKREMTLQDFNDMLLDNEVTNFDPVSEAFKVRLNRSTS